MEDGELEKRRTDIARMKLSAEESVLDGDALRSKLVQQANGEIPGPLHPNEFHHLADSVKHAASDNQALCAIVGFMHEQAFYMEHIRDHVQNLVNQNVTLTERITSLENEVRAAIRDKHTWPALRRVRIISGRDSDG